MKLELMYSNQVLLDRKQRALARDGTVDVVYSSRDRTTGFIYISSLMLLRIEQQLLYTVQEQPAAIGDEALTFIYSTSQLLLEIKRQLCIHKHQQAVARYGQQQHSALKLQWVRLFFTCYLVAKRLWSSIISEKFTFRQNFSKGDSD
jgi:hypothetical protein